MSVMTAQIAGKWNVAKALWQFVHAFRNWRDVWAAYRVRAALPPLEFRDGMVLHHGPGDDPIYLFREVFLDDCYLHDGFYRPEPGHTVLDVGANIGAFALMIESRARGAWVHCYEPGSGACATLRRNVEANGLGELVTVYPIAVSDRNGTIELLQADIPMHRSIFANDYAAGGRETVETIPLPEAIDRAGGHVDLLKVDVEGAEIEIVDGMTPGDWARVDRAAIEYHDFFRPGCHARVSEALRGAGFDRIETLAEPSMEGIGMIRASRGR
jgi:FkbM family methyltransferase